MTQSVLERALEGLHTGLTRTLPPPGNLREALHSFVLSLYIIVNLIL
jgi:hypothetical protein